MKDRSNLVFYPVLCVTLIYALYLYFQGEPFFIKKNEYINDYIFYASAVLMGIAYVVNLIDRYSAVTVFTAGKSKMNFTWSEPLSTAAMSWPLLIFGISVSVTLLLGFVLAFITSSEWPSVFYPGILVFVSAIEKLVWFVICIRMKWFRAGMNNNLLVVNYGTLGIYSFNQLTSVEEKYDELLFVYKSGNVKYIKTKLVKPEALPGFYSRLKEISNEKGFYFNPPVTA
ncbi:MAG: hypothetical protein ACOZCO_15700 [Bacteroidota bacterium]